MIKWFRSGIAVKAAGVVFVVLMLMFVLTSVDWGKLTTGTSIGKVNGRPIDARQYQREVQQATEVRQRQAPQSLGLDDYEAIRNDVWDQFVTNELLRSEYSRRGIRISDDEILDAIRTAPLQDFYRLPEFQTDGKFDPAKYQRWLGSSVAQQFLPAMEAQYRDQLEQAKLFRAVTADVFLSDPALWERYRDEHEAVKVDLAAIVPSAAVPDSAVSVTPTEVEAWYQAHRNELDRPKTIFTSFIALSRLADASDTAAALARAEGVRKELVGGAPFAEVAKRESADTVSGNKGGDLGEWTRGAFDPKFDSVAFSMKLNEISEPVQTQFGYHLIEVTSRTGNKAKARHILIPIEVAGHHRDRLDAQADSLDKLAAEHADPAALDTAARALHLQVGHAKPLPAGSKMQIGLLTLPDAGVWAAEAKVGQISQIIETPFAMYVFRVDSIHPAGIPKLDAVRDTVTRVVRDAKKRTQARKIAEDLVKRVDGGSTLAQAADAMKLPHEVYGPFTRLSSPIKDPFVTGAAFGLPTGKHSGVLDTKEGLYVLQVLEHTPADSAAFTKDLDKLRAQAMQQARQERVQTYLAGLRTSARIVDNRSKMVQQVGPTGS
ncbi:MAG TPA: peptidyl-prolyl cis-trans isomerase [Gemmatimonadales bacterium]|nr:peptidyl-prolyl cis-trans isomerase [Gemmatimonadales bacterium]